jgi:cell division protein FtsB
MRIITVFLSILLLLLQEPLWFGRGGWVDALEMETRINDVAAKNSVAMLRNGNLQAEVSDLQNGLQAIEDRARQELGMIKEGEIYVQFTSGAKK